MPDSDELDQIPSSALVTEADTGEKRLRICQTISQVIDWKGLFVEVADLRRIWRKINSRSVSGEENR